MFLSVSECHFLWNNNTRCSEIASFLHRFYTKLSFENRYRSWTLTQIKPWLDSGTMFLDCNLIKHGMLFWPFAIYILCRIYYSNYNPGWHLGHAINWPPESPATNVQFLLKFLLIAAWRIILEESWKSKNNYWQAERSKVKQTGWRGSVRINSLSDTMHSLIRLAARKLRKWGDWEGGGKKKIPDGMKEGEKKGCWKWKDKLGLLGGALQIKFPLIVALSAHTKWHGSKWNYDACLCM